jgi:hypothetical protein
MGQSRGPLRSPTQSSTHKTMPIRRNDSNNRLAAPIRCSGTANEIPPPRLWQLNFFDSRTSVARHGPRSGPRLWPSGIGDGGSRFEGRSANVVDHSVVQRKAPPTKPCRSEQPIRCTVLLHRFAAPRPPTESLRAAYCYEKTSDSPTPDPIRGPRSGLRMGDRGKMADASKNGPRATNTVHRLVKKQRRWVKQNWRWPHVPHGASRGQR